MATALFINYNGKVLSFEPVTVDGKPFTTDKFGRLEIPKDGNEHVIRIQGTEFIEKIRLDFLEFPLSKQTLLDRFIGLFVH